MPKASDMSPETSKKFAMTFAIATIALAVAVTVLYMIDGLGFPIGIVISYSIAPILLNCFILFVDDETKNRWALHNIGGILLYIYFGAWSIFGAFNTITLLLASLSTLNLIIIVTLALQAVYTLDGLIGLVYYHNLRTAAKAGGSEPLVA